MVKTEEEIIHLSGFKWVSFKTLINDSYQPFGTEEALLKNFLSSDCYSDDLIVTNTNQLFKVHGPYYADKLNVNCYGQLSRAETTEEINQIFSDADFGLPESREIKTLQDKILSLIDKYLDQDYKAYKFDIEYEEVIAAWYDWGRFDYFREIILIRADKNRLIQIWFGED